MGDKTVMCIGGNKMEKLFLGIFASREHTETLRGNAWRAQSSARIKNI
jgi:hypothetical protein